VQTGGECDVFNTIVLCLRYSKWLTQTRPIVVVVVSYNFCVCMCEVDACLSNYISEELYIINRI